MGNYTLLTSITLDTAGLKQGTEAATQEVNQLKDGIKSANSQSSNSFTELSNKVAEPQMNLRELMRAFRELSKVSFAGKSKEEIEQIKAELASLYDKQQDLLHEVQAQSKDPFEKYAQGAQGLATMMQGVVGVQSLFGTKSEELNVLMQRTIALMGVSNALQQASVFFKENALGIEIRLGTAKLTNLIRENALQSTQIIQQRLANAAEIEGAATTGLLGQAQLALNAVMAANPIGVIVVGMLALGAAATALVLALKDDNDALEQQNKLMAELAGWQRNLAENFQRDSELKKANGANELQLLNDKLAELYKEEQLNNEQIKTLEAKKELTDEEKKQLEELTSKENEYGKAIYATEIARDVQVIKDKKAKADQLKDAEEFKNQLIIALKIGKAGELAVLDDWKKKSEEKYKNNADVIVAITESYNKKRLDIINKYNALASAGNNAINDVLQGAGQNSKKNIDSSISGVKDEPLDLGTDTENKIKSINPATITSMQNFTGVLAAMSIGYDSASSRALQFASAQEAIKSSFEGLNGVLSQGADSFKDFAKSIGGAVRSIIGALIGESVAMAVTNAMSSLAKTPYGFLLIPAVSALAAGIAKTAFNSLVPKFAEGGIVGGYSYSGDNIPAMVNSGEMILNNRQQANLFDLLNKGGSSETQNFEFQIQGDTLVAITNKMNKKNSFR